MGTVQLMTTTLKIINRRLIKQVFNTCGYGLVIIPLRHNNLKQEFKVLMADDLLNEVTQ